MKLLYSLLLWLIVTSNACGATAVGKVETKLNAEGDIWVGQRVPLTIKILAPGFSIDGVPAIDIPEIPGLIVLKLPGPPGIGNETIDDTSYVTQLHEFALFPQRAAEFTLPAFTVRFASSAGFGMPVTSFSVKTRPLKFVSKLPPGAEKLQTIISTSSLTLQETWSPDIRAAKVGDAVTRTVTMQAADVPGMEFPPLAWAPIEGVGVYPKRPVVTDVSERGSLSGRRIETVTYVFEQPGIQTLPAYSLGWWKLDEKVLRRDTLDARTISVSAAADVVQHSPDEPVSVGLSPWGWVAGITVVLAVVIVVVTRSLPRLRVQPDSETAFFAALVAACESNSRQQILAALTAWLDHRDPSSELVSVSQWAAQTGHEELIKLVDRLEADLFRSSILTADDPFPGSALLACIREVRSQQAHQGRAGERRSKLAALNPM